MSNLAPESYVNAPVQTASGASSTVQPLQISNTAPRGNINTGQFRPGSINFVGQQTIRPDAGYQANANTASQTTDWILKAGQEAIAPYVNAEKQALMMKGVQEVSSGKAIQDIIDEQPWYTKIFGSSDLITAARAYTAQTNVNKFQAEVMTNMHNISNASPEEAQQYINSAMSSFLTGDALTDAATTQSMIQASTALFEQWTKQNYKNKQIQASQSQQDAYTSSATSYSKIYNAAAIDGTLGGDVVLNAQKSLIEGMKPVIGQDIEAWKGNVDKSIRTMAINGDFHAIGVVAKSGLLSSFDPDARKQLTAFVKSAEQEHQMNLRTQPEFASQISQLSFNLKTGKMTAAEVLPAINAINQEAAAKYGYTESLISPREVLAYQDDSVNFLIGESNRAVTQQRNDEIARLRAEGKQQAADELIRRKVTENVNIATSGAPFPAGYSTEDLNKVGSIAYDNLEKNQQGAGTKAIVSTFVNNGGFVYESLQNRFQAPFKVASQTEWTPEFDQRVLPQFNQMISVTGGSNAAIKYYGADNYRKVLDYQAAVRAGTPPDLAYNQSFVVPERLGDMSKVGKKEREKLNDAVSEQFPIGWADFSTTKLGAGAVDTLSARTQHYFATVTANQPNLSEEQRYQEAAKLAMHDGNVAVYGQYAWPRNPTTPEAHTLTSTTPKQFYNLFYDELKNSKSMAGLDLTQARVVERNEGKKTTFSVYVPDGKGSTKVQVITTDMLNARKAAEIKKQQEHANRFYKPMSEFSRDPLGTEAAKRYFQNNPRK